MTEPTKHSAPADHEHDIVVTERNFEKWPHHIRFGCAVAGCTFDTFKYLHAPPGRR